MAGFVGRRQIRDGSDTNPGNTLVAENAGGHYRFDAPFAEPCLYRISTPMGKEDPLTLRLLVSRLRKTFEDAQEMCFLPKGDYSLVGIRKWDEMLQQHPYREQHAG